MDNSYQKEVYIDKDVYEAVKRVALQSGLSVEEWVYKAIAARLKHPRYRILRSRTLVGIWQTAISAVKKCQTPEELLAFRKDFFMYNFGITIKKKGVMTPWENKLYMGIYPPVPLEEGAMQMEHVEDINPGETPERDDQFEKYLEDLEGLI